jgi:hypothetical protein
LELEHSLASLSKWESEYEKPFLGEQDKSNEEILGYIVSMTVTEDVPAEVYEPLRRQHRRGEPVHQREDDRNNDPREWLPQRRNREIITAEIIYHWMVALQIPFETQHWHLNRLITLVRVST